MKLFTSHTRPDQPPILLREGFSWPAFFFGFLYLAVHRAYIAAALNLAALLLAIAITTQTGVGAPLLGLAVLQGLLAPDFHRWTLAQRGFRPGPIVAARDQEQAFTRLLDARPNLLPTQS